MSCAGESASWIRLTSCLPVDIALYDIVATIFCSNCFTSSKQRNNQQTMRSNSMGTPYLLSTLSATTLLSCRIYARTLSVGLKQQGRLKDRHNCDLLCLLLASCLRSERSSHSRQSSSQSVDTKHAKGPQATKPGIGVCRRAPSVLVN